MYQPKLRNMYQIMMICDKLYIFLICFANFLKTISDQSLKTSKIELSKKKFEAWGIKNHYEIMHFTIVFNKKNLYPDLSFINVT